ncbi:MAG: type 4a pilus biogenesis protein PilO [Pyrinomonadaceae bacterium]
MRKINIKQMPRHYQLFIFMGISLAVYGVFWYLVSSGTRAETQAINDQVAVLQQQNAQAQIASQRLNEFRASYKARQEEYDELKALLPEQRELTSVLQGLQDRARGSRLSLRRFAPRDDIQQDFYSGKPVEVEVTSTFANLREFFDQMAKYQRIVSITDFGITQLKDQNAAKTIDARFLMTAYYVSAEDLQKSSAVQPAATSQPAPPAPAK